MIEIDKNVPMPESTGGRIPKYPWREMQIGDSFLFSREKSMSASTALASGVAQRTGMEFRCRTTPEGVRVWRIK